MEDKLTEILLKITEIVNANYDHFDENFENNSTKALKYPYEVYIHHLLVAALQFQQTCWMNTVYENLQLCVFN